VSDPPNPVDANVDGDGDVNVPTVIVDGDAPLPVEDLKTAVGVIEDKTPAAKHDDDHDDEPKPVKRKRRGFLAGFLALAAIAIGVLVLLGHLNADRYLLTCEPDKVIAQHGRGFPPWGTRDLTGAEWAAISIPADAECTPRETDSQDELAGWYLDLLVERADKALLAHDPMQAEVASAQLQQALLLARSPDRRDARHKIEHMLGDVDYWRATAKISYARSQLLDAAKQFDTAGAAVPSHANDAAKQAAYARRIADQLLLAGSGAGSTLTPAGPAPEQAPQTPAPMGTALPVEPTRVQGDPLPMPASSSPPVSTGGVLL
jgi:hypothetical protein